MNRKELFVVTSVVEVSSLKRQVEKLAQAFEPSEGESFAIELAQGVRAGYSWRLLGRRLAKKYQVILHLTEVGKPTATLWRCTWTMKDLLPWLPEAVVGLVERLPGEVPVAPRELQVPVNSDYKLFLPQGASPEECFLALSCLPVLMNTLLQGERITSSQEWTTRIARLSSFMASGPLPSEEASYFFLTGKVTRLLKLPPPLERFSWEEEEPFLLVYLSGSEYERANLLLLLKFFEKLPSEEEGGQVGPVSHHYHFGDFLYYHRKRAVDPRIGREPTPPGAHILSDLPLHVLPWQEEVVAAADLAPLLSLSPEEASLLLFRLASWRMKGYLAAWPDSEYPQALSKPSALRVGLATLSQGRGEDALLREWLALDAAALAGYSFSYSSFSSPFTCEWVRALLPHREEFTVEERFTLLFQLKLLEVGRTLPEGASPFTPEVQAHHLWYPGLEWYFLPRLREVFGEVKLARLYLQEWTEERPLKFHEVERLAALPQSFLTLPPSWWVPLVREDS